MLAKVYFLEELAEVVHIPSRLDPGYVGGLKTHSWTGSEEVLGAAVREDNVLSALLALFRLEQSKQLQNRLTDGRKS